MRLDRLIAFHRATSTRDGYGEEPLTWSLLAEEWAGVRWGRGDERRQAAAVSAPQTATFIVRNNERTRAVRVTDRIAFDGSAWNIGGIADLTAAEIEITAVRDAASTEVVVASLTPGDSPAPASLVGIDDLTNLP